VTGADAGSIYVVETAEDGRSKRLRFKMSQNDSCQFEAKEFTIPVSTRSIAGYAAATLAPINIPNVHDIPADAPYGYDPSFDRRVGYTTRSMIAVPMISAEDEVMGVIQLINKKRQGRAVLRTEADFDREVVPFDARSAELLMSLASQAGIVLENAMLYDEIRRIFEGFVRASVQAIEQRDPTTSGHSLRVSVLSCRLAEKVDRADSGLYAASKFSLREIKELEYASLLHDFGKIGVREQVLVKAKKLYPHVLDAIRERVHYIEKEAEVASLKQKLELVQIGAATSELAAVDEWLREKRASLREIWRTVQDANEPTVLSEGDFSRISEIARIEFVDGQGEKRLLLTPEDTKSLSIRKGSLNDEEMSEIRSHVVHTFEFLTRIPWGKSFSRVADIAGAHHEKLNGTGYPHGKKATDIPLQSKIMTIADIYDALTARDRPYKKAMPAERALGILDFEVKDGHVDPELMRIFRESEVYKAVEERLEY
jgi:HD-GYP domain-containing protein (c-di-GMP phosphodiesterase class II)